MSSGKPPITLEQGRALAAVAYASMYSNTGPLTPDEGLALKALLEAIPTFEPVRQSGYTICPTSGRVRFSIWGTQHGGAYVTVPFEMDPDTADKIAIELRDSAALARMNIRPEGGSGSC